MDPRLLNFILSLLVFFCVGSTHAAAQNYQRLDKAFARVDQNGDQKLSTQELSLFAQLKSRLEGADSDQDGFVSRNEFYQAMTRGSGKPEESTGRLVTGDFVRSVQVKELKRRYRVHVPESYDAQTPTPVIIAFHGGGGNPESMIRLSGLNDKAEEAGFLVAYPYGTGRQEDRQLTFNGGGCCGYAHRKKIDDIAFTRTLLDDLAAAANIDPKRVYATGISNGAIMTYYVASELSDRIAAIAPVGGPMMTDSCNPVRPVSVMHFHGTGDELAPFEGGQGIGSPGVPAFFRPKFNSVQHSIKNWIKANGCDPKPAIESLPDTVNDGMKVTRKSWRGGKQGSEVVLLEIENGGHTWPGQKPVSEILGRSTMDISANDLMWEFFQKHPIK